MRVSEIDLSNLPLQDLQRKLSEAMKQIYTAVNGRLALKENVECNIVEVVFSTANAQVQVDHGLGRIPTVYIQGKSTVATSVYDGTSSNTDKHLFVRASAAATVKLVIF